MSEEKKISLNEREELMGDDNAPFSFDLRDLWSMFLLNIRWFILSVLACLLIAGAYLYWAKPSVTVTGKMQLKDTKKESGMGASLAALSSSIPFGLGSSLGGATSGDTEMEIMKSTLMIRDVVNDMGLHTEYRLSKWGRSRLLYREQPVKVDLEKSRLEWFDQELPLTTHQIELEIQKDASGYTVEGIHKENKDEIDLPSQTFSKLPATLKTEIGTLTITENQLLTPKLQELYQDGYTLKVSIIPPMIAANRFMAALTIEPVSKKVATILNISLKDENVLRGIDFVNNLVEVYNRRANEDKNEELMRTDEFVNERLAKVDAELGSSDADWEHTKKNFQVTNPEVDAEEVMTRKGEYETQLVNFGTQIQLQDYLNDYINDSKNLMELIPVNVGVYGGDALPMISQHNDLVNQRRELLKSVSEKSPMVQKVNQSIRELQPNIQTAMKRDRQSLLIKRQTVEREYNKYNSRVLNAPQQERILTGIGRQREIKQAVYLVMLQKREQTAMELVNTTEKGKLIDETQPEAGSASPKKKVVLLVALFLGVLIPFGILFLLRMMKSEVETRQDVESQTSLPIIGEIPPGDSSEALRNLRTNLLQCLKSGQKVILLASEADGDGKTYLAERLNDTLKSIGKKALYLNADLRKAGNGQHPLDVLASADFVARIEQAKANNDYVILDSPSISRYYDAYQLAQFADATLFVVKSGVTKKAVLSSLDKESRLPNISLIINATNLSKQEYQLYYKQ